ncbi:MAG: LysR family transcriptional regulator [Pigmentiphaga sp.]
MDLRQLRYFIAIVEHGSLSEAARQLHVVQPALSQRLADLEKSLNVQLLIRNRNGVTLTPAGAALYEHAPRLFKQISSIESLVQEKAGQLTGEVTIGVLRSMSALIGKRLFLTMKARLPHVRLNIRVGYTSELEKMLHEGKLDLAMQVTPYKTKDPAIVYFEHLFAVGTQTLLGAGNQPLRLTDLSSYPIIIASRQAAHMVLRAAAERQDIELNIIADIEDSQVLLDICETGTAITFLSGVAAQNSAQARGLSIRRLDDPNLSRQVKIAVNTQIPMTQAILETRAILEEILIQCGQLSPAGEEDATH